MIRSMYYAKNGELRTNLDDFGFAQALKDPDGILWVDFEATPVEADEKILSETFGFHPLAIDDALQESHIPKVDDWGEYLYIVLHTVIFDPQNDAKIETQELDIFLGSNYMVTHHDPSISALNHVWEDSQRDKRHWSNGVDNLLYKLVDEVVINYMPVVDIMDDEIEILEGHILNNPTPETVERIFKLKRAVARLRRVIGPQREVLNKLARDDYSVIDAKARIYFRDVYDHLVRLYDIAESIRDLISGALDTYLSVINNRMNEIMKTLTVITTLFMPISFLTGFFGMNFFQPASPLNIWTGRPAFLITILILLMTPFGMFLWIRKRGWS